MNLPTPARTLTTAEAVRDWPCRLCGRKPGKPCTSKGDHLARWLGAYEQRRITRDDLKHVIVRLVVVTKWCVVPEERAA